jgi:hypothetical protein
MPPTRAVPRLDHLCLLHVAALCSKGCEYIECNQAANAKATHGNRNENGNVPPLQCANHARKKGGEEEEDDDEDDEADGQPCVTCAVHGGLRRLLRRLPGSVLENMIPQVLRSQTVSVKKNRSHKGLVTALQCLLQPNLKRLDIGALFHAGRLYGDINTRCKAVLRNGLQRLTRLTHINLQTKCNDEILVQLARSCPNLEELHAPMSDVTDRGLMALCGISIDGEVGEEDGCKKLSRVGLYHCANITPTGVGCVLRNLPDVVNLSYDKLADAVETVAKVDADFVLGRRTLKIVHLDQFSDYYDFAAHSDMLRIILKVCPKLESLRFYVSDEGCKSLSTIPGVTHLQLEMEDVGNGFRQLTRLYGNLVSLQLTFRTMPFSQLIDIADNCPNLAVLRLIGFDIVSSHNLRAHNNVFNKLKVVDLRLMRGGGGNDDFLDDAADGDQDLDTIDSITPQLLHFLLDFSHSLEELTVQAVANFMTESFLMGLLRKNPLCKMKRLRLYVSPSTSLKANVARYVIDSLPELDLIALSKWNIPSRQLKALATEAKRKNYNLTFA